MIPRRSLRGSDVEPTTDEGTEDGPAAGTASNGRSRGRRFGRALLALGGLAAVATLLAGRRKLPASVRELRKTAQRSLPEAVPVSITGDDEAAEDEETTDDEDAAGRGDAVEGGAATDSRGEGREAAADGSTKAMARRGVEGVQERDAEPGQVTVDEGVVERVTEPGVDEQSDERGKATADEETERTDDDGTGEPATDRDPTPR